MFGGRIGTFNIILEIGNLNEGKWPLETAEKRTGLEFRLRCGEVGRPAAALHFFGGVLDQRQKKNLRPQPRTHAGGANIGIVA